MRVLLLLLALVGAGLGGWWVLRERAPEPALDDLGAGPAAATPVAVRPLEAAAPEVVEARAPEVLARIGVVRPGEPRPLLEADAPPWETFRVTPRRSPGVRLSGEALLEALATRLYVRVRRPADLEALRALRLDVEEGEQPLTSLLHLLEAQGWKAAVQEPRVMLYPAGEAGA
ncbi:MAG: hypothetical protein ACKOSS_11870, partial [Planctomycetia bacterium]